MIGWLDCAAGASGDMVLGAVIDAGADVEVVRAAIAAVAPEHTQLEPQPVRRAGLAALHAQVLTAESTTRRGLADVLTLIDRAPLEAEVAAHAHEVFTRLAEAEAAVHGSTPDKVHFHEVGALDAIADVIGACAGLVELGLAALHASAVAVGSGSVDTVHGTLSVPPPAVARLLEGVPSYAGPTATELCTPTGAALLTHWATSFGPQPPMRVARIGYGAGTKDFASHPNVLRLFVGTPEPSPATDPPTAAHLATGDLVYETNVDDFDPRLWPTVLQRLLDAGASDAWLTPIVMKKGRPAYTLSVLVPRERSAVVRRVIFAETSSIGLRTTEVDKIALARAFTTVEVDGMTIGIKVASDGDRVVNVQPEYDDVVAAAQRLDRPVKTVLAAAIAASAALWRHPPGHR